MKTPTLSRHDFRKDHSEAIIAFETSQFERGLMTVENEHQRVARLILTILETHSNVTVSLNINRITGYYGMDTRSIY